MYGNVLDIGTGWLPITTILFHIAGAANVTTVDVERFMDLHTTREAKSLIRNRIVETASHLGISLEDVSTKLNSLAPTYIVPWDPSSFPADRFDIIVSRDTFEHIPATILERYLAEFHRILCRNGLMCHLIDNSDHWSHRDARLSRLNMLRYEDGVWWRLMSKAVYQNRLRHSDYARMFERTGWRIIRAHSWGHDRGKEDLKALPLASPFIGRTADDLAALGSMFLLARGRC
jgi:cyclopropane fatty-acyl-phospholipid synthase-like methyltransferase